MSRETARKGSALVLVLITSVVFTILIGALFMLFKMNTESQMWARDRIQARYTAEAGASLAVHMIMGGEDVPQGDSARIFLPEVEGSWFDLPGDDLGDVIVYVDPNDQNFQVLDANAYEIRALGRVTTANGYRTHCSAVAMSPENFARFAAFQHAPDLGGYYGDGYRFDGPFYANGPVCIWSASAGRSNDPLFYSITLTSDYYYNSQGTASNPTSVPHVGDLWVEPYERHSLGAPYFEMGAEPIPFGPDELNWQVVENAAASGGLFLDASDVPNNCRVILRQDSLIVKKSAGEAPISYCLSDLSNPVVWMDNNNTDRVYIRGYAISEAQRAAEGMTQAVTIGANGTIEIMGPNLYQNPDPEDPDNRVLLGLMSVYGDLIIADQPAAPDAWGVGWQIVTENYSGAALEFDGVLLALDGDIWAQTPTQPTPGVDFVIMGGYILLAEGWTSTPTSGYTLQIWYDPRLMTMHPPFFPQTGDWTTIYWEDNADYDEHNIWMNWY